MYKVLVISMASPILVGIYNKQNKLIETFSKDGKTSDVLPEIFEEVLDKYELEAIYYSNGPGSYMSIKVAYMFLKTLAISKNIGLYAVSGFKFNNNSPIKALGKKYFFNSNDDTILLNFLKENETIEVFSLPNKLDINMFSQDSLPNYNLPAIN